ncbi:MAG: hypothetical protein DBX47_00745 [Clostridiales bacterium]|nr:MAG: hypothetical protein DBX47_00745 [Clostridiales bacterium]
MIDIKKYNKIIIIGSGGSGKSTFAKKLGAVIGLPVIHLDNEFWQPGWAPTPRDEWIEKQKQFISREKWIIDGNYGGTMDLRFEAAELVVFLDINRFICVWSAAKRTGKKRSDLPDYLREPKMFSKDFYEFAKWIWEYPEKDGKAILERHKCNPDKPFLHIKNRKELEMLLS